MAHGNEINNKRFYWLKMDRHFFGDARVKKLRSLPKGDSCVIVYLKLLLLSIELSGVLVYEGIEDTFEKEMALKTGEKPIPTETTIRFLREQGMLIPAEGREDEFLLIPAQNSVGSESKSNVYKREKREKNVGLEIFQPPSNQIPIEKEIDIDKELDINEERKKIDKNQAALCAGARESERESYDSIMKQWEVGPLTRAALGQFLRHCALNKKIVTNDKLIDIIDRLQDAICRAKFGKKCDEMQSKAVYRAINGGYFDIRV